MRWRSFAVARRTNIGPSSRVRGRYLAPSRDGLRHVVQPESVTSAGCPGLVDKVIRYGARELS